MAFMALKLFGRKDSVNVQKVMWLLAELNLDYEQIEKGGKFGGLDEPAFLAMNPAGRVPVLLDGDHAVFESNAILRYLATTQPGGEAFYPADPALRGKIDAQMDFALGTLYPDFVSLFMGVVKTAPAKRNAKVIAIATRRFQTNMLTVGQTLGDGNWLVGDSMTLADIAVGAFMFRFYALPVIKRHKQARVEGWTARLLEREAHKTTMGVNFSHMFVD